MPKVPPRPSSAARSAAADDKRAPHDPFAPSDDPLAPSTDPFLSTHDPFAPRDDPFAPGGDLSSQTDAFGSEDDPFAPRDDPFAFTTPSILSSEPEVMELDASSLDATDEALSERPSRPVPPPVALHQKTAELAEHRARVDSDPFAVESLHALFDAYVAAREPDRAWCIASALVLVGEASSVESRYFQDHRRTRGATIRTALSLSVWNVLRHPDLEPLLTGLFAVIAQNLRRYISVNLRDHGIHKRRDKLDLTSDTRLMRILTASAQQLAVPEFNLFAKAEYLGLRNANVDPTAMIAGSDVLAGKPELELTFEAAKAVALMRVEFYLASAFPSASYLQMFFYAAYAITTGRIVGNVDAEAVQRYASDMRETPGAIQIQQRIQRLIRAETVVDIPQWLAAVDHSANRMGLLICGDLVTAAQMVEQEPLIIGKATSAEKLRALVAFGVSEPYFELRAALGAALQHR